MESLPVLSNVKGNSEPLRNKDQPIVLHEIIQHTIQSLDSLSTENDKFATIHGITSVGEPSLIFGETQLPLRLVNEQANQVARAIQRGFPATANADGDTVVVVDLPPSSQLITALLAVWKLGAAYLPLEATFPDNRVQHILGESKPALVIALQTEENDRYHGSPVVSYDTLIEDARLLSTDDLPSGIPWAKGSKEEDQIGIIMYTSGSTGEPKGVRMSHRTILNGLMWRWKTIPYSATETTFIFKSAITFVDSIAEIWGPILRGRSLVILTKKQVIDVEVFIETLDKYKIERLLVVPSQLRSMLLYLEMKSNEKTPFQPHENMTSNTLLSSLKYCVCSGEPLPPPLAQKFYQFFKPGDHILLNFYGCTEVMGDILSYTVTPEEAMTTDKIPIGLPLDNTNVYILDKQFRTVNNGEIGELFVSGNLATGYVNGKDPDNRFIENPIAVDPVHRKMYKTGDYARVVEGKIYYEGRTDSQIKVRGHKVDLSEIEAALAKVHSVNKSSVLCYKAGSIDQALLAFATVKCSEMTSIRVEEHLHQLLPPYMVPYVVVLPEIPLLVNGKVDRQFLLKQYEQKIKEVDSQEVSFDYTDVPKKCQGRAKVLFETVANTLKHSVKNKITASSNYFQLGGNSLNAVLAVTTLRDLGYIISVGDFISAETLTEMMLRMSENEEATNQVSTEEVCQISPNKYQVELLNDKLKEDATRYECKLQIGWVLKPNVEEESFSKGTHAMGTTRPPKLFHSALYSRIFADSFCEKGELESFLSIRKEDYEEFVNVLWPSCVEQKLSFAVKNAEGEVLSVCLNMDLYQQPEMQTITSELRILLDFEEFLEGPFRDNVLPKGIGQVLHSYMMGTAAEISTQQNIELFLFMEQETLKLSTVRGFAGIFTTNISPLTQQLGIDLLQFKVLLDYQINKYTAPDGSKPFAAADNSYRCVVSWKAID